MLLQLTLIVQLQSGLGRGQIEVIRVVNKIELQPWIDAITEGVKCLQGRDAVPKHALAALLLYILLGVTWQGGGNSDTFAGQKFGHVFVSFLTQDCQVAAIDDLRAGGPGGAHQVFEMGVHLRGAAGQVEDSHGVAVHVLQHHIYRLLIHHLGASGPGIDVTVGAGQVAFVAQIHLQRFQDATGDRGKVGLDE